MRDKELHRRMSDAAAKAVESCLAAGYSRHHKVTIDSALRAAEDEHRRLRPEDFIERVPSDPPDDAWSERADVAR